jgi:hypothetical protein
LVLGLSWLSCLKSSFLSWPATSSFLLHLSYSFLYQPKSKRKISPCSFFKSLLNYVDINEVVIGQKPSFFQRNLSIVWIEFGQSFIRLTRLRVNLDFWLDQIESIPPPIYSSTQTGPGSGSARSVSGFETIQRRWP